MRVLWVCNQMLPAVAEHLGLTPSNKEGWISGLFEELTDGNEKQLELGVCFPVADKNDKRSLRGRVRGIPYYGFVEDPVKLHVYDKRVENQFRSIYASFQPDIVHIFGTEYAHALAAARVWGKPEKTLVGLQGIMRGCTNAYEADLPEYVVKRLTFRDLVKKDSILQQKRKFSLRAEHETELLKLTMHVTGRTEYDYEAAVAVNPDVHYHFMNETMRSNFYSGELWDAALCIRHTIFVSQGNYPLKGLHKVLEAMPIIREQYPDVKLMVAGDSITANETWKDKLKISSYGKYLLELVEENNLQEQVTFLGKLSADQMKHEFTHCNVFVSASSLENSSNSVGEAMLLGVPIVASKVGGLTSLMDDGKECLFYDFEKAEELAQKVMGVFADGYSAAAMGRRAGLRAKKTHDPDQNRKRLRSIYDEMYL